MCLLESLQPVLGGALCAPNALAVRVACLNAVESMVEHVTDKEHRAHQQALQAHLPTCLAVLQEALASGNMTHAKECFTSFIAIAKWAPRPHESQSTTGPAGSTEGAQTPDHRLLVTTNMAHGKSQFQAAHGVIQAEETRTRGYGPSMKST